jgi:hypothetical protein
MAGFDAKEGENWLVPMLMDVTRCECKYRELASYSIVKSYVTSIYLFSRWSQLPSRVRCIH